MHLKACCRKATRSHCYVAPIGGELGNGEVLDLNSYSVAAKELCDLQQRKELSRNSPLEVHCGQGVDFRSTKSLSTVLGPQPGIKISISAAIIIVIIEGFHSKSFVFLFISFYHYFLRLSYTSPEFT